jgi:ribulose-phosphate 3-epimerase
MKAQIVPAILEPDQKKFDMRYQVVSKHSNFAQLDVLDGSFLPQTNFHDPDYINSISPIDLELHFMTDFGEKDLDNWDYPWVKKIIFHIEGKGDTQSTIDKIQAMGKETGISLNPETSLSAIAPYVEKMDCVQVMTIHPGAMGTPFLPETLDKVREIKKLYPQLEIEVDGGMNPENARLAAEAGATKIVVGSYLKNEEFISRLEELKKAVTN